MEELNSGPPKINPSNSREEDLDPGPPDYKSSALPPGHARLPNDMVSRHQTQCLIPAGARLVIALLPRMIITGSHLYIWVERGTVQENCFSEDDMIIP